jgi:hypothetical protein
VYSSGEGPFEDQINRVERESSSELDHTGGFGPWTSEITLLNMTPALVILSKDSLIFPGWPDLVKFEYHLEYFF